MIEREFINQKTKEFYIKKYIEDSLKGVGISQIKLQKIPLGEKIIIFTNRPSLIVGSKGANIRDLTKVLKTKFKLENPQIEINEVKDIFLDAKIVAQRIAGSLERFGSARFKGIGHKVMENVLNSGALGVEIIISGKLPSARARSWRCDQGYLKKCGEIAETGVRKAQASALLKSGVVGVKVAIMPPDIILPDHIEILSEPVQIIEVVQDEKKPSSKKSTSSKGKSRKKSAPKKKAKEKEEEKVNITTEAVVSETISAPETTSTPQQEQKEESDENN